MVSLGKSVSGNSYGVLLMFFTSWLVGSIVFVSEFVKNIEDGIENPIKIWAKMLGIVLGMSFIIALVYWMWHAGILASLARSPASTMESILEQVKRSESILTNYYIYLGLLIFLCAYLLPVDWPKKVVRWSGFSFAAAIIIFIIAFSIASYTNLRVIQADIAFKTAETFAKPNSWPVAITIYNRAIELAPNEDFYYLFLGRAYLEHAKTLDDQEERENVINQAAKDLRYAQEINPLNTDHTANLARLYSLWSSFSNEPDMREMRANTSSEFFSRAVVLSPNNTRIWDEWAVHLLSVMDQPEEAYERLVKSEQLDPNYDWTYGLLGDYYARNAMGLGDDQIEEKLAVLSKAADSYQKALGLPAASSGQIRYNFAIALGGTLTQLERHGDAILAYEQALELFPNSPDRWKILETIARLYARLGNWDNALIYAQNTLAETPEDQKERVESLINQINSQR
jgi:tetratricopeptide (TPR) repeat protein